MPDKLKRTFVWRVKSAPDSRAISAYMVSSRSSCWASRFVICFFLSEKAES